jgi:DNA helicase HerA-like ATPase
MSLNILIGGNGDTRVSLPAVTANRHGMVAGATGTGKTITLQILAEGFSRIGVPVFLADVKGDLSGLAQAGASNDKIDSRIQTIGIEAFSPQPNPTLFWDLFANQGHPVRTTISDMGPLLLSNLLELNDTQSGILYAAFSIADDNGLLLLDLKDLKSMLSWMADHARELSSEYGNITRASVGAIQRRLLVLEEQGAENFFGEPALSLNDLMITDFSGRGVISMLDVTRLMQTSPRLYATFLLWLLSELFEQLPEIGDPEKPRLALFFDEAHLLFDRSPRALIDKVEQVVRLIRSKGVSVFFITQNPLDIPVDILGQLGTRIQHALRAFTPKDRKAVKAVAETFRENPGLDTMKAITELGTGEALVSVLQADGSPTPVERILVRPPESRIGPLSDAERNEVLGRSPLKGRYDQLVDRESAFELLKKRAEDASRMEAARAAEEAAQKEAARAAKTSQQSSRPRGRPRQGMGETMMKSVLRSVGSSIGRRLARGILGSLLGGK